MKPEPIKILEIIEEGITKPINDGSRGSALYKIPFRLSRKPSPEWAELFLHAWERPPSFTSMHRPGIARVSGDQIFLDGTTIEEVEKHHKKTLQLCVEEANNDEAVWLAKVARQREVEKQEAEAHKKHVKDAASRIKFD